MRFLEIFKRQILLMHVSGIPVRADYRWVFVLFLMSAVTASSINTLVDNGTASFFFGLVTTLVFFASIFLHELAHAFAARMEGVEVVEIMLHPFGGLARLKHEPETPRAELRIALAGPAASFLIAAFFVVLMAVVNSAGLNILAGLLFLLALWNFMLAVFNLFPGYPLDGGRVLRAYLWRSGKDLNEATILTGRGGQIIGGALIAFGLVIALVRADFFTGFWTILVGLFLYDAAKGIIKEVNDSERLRVEDVMSLPVGPAPDSSILEFVDNILPLYRVAVFPVVKQRRLLGILLLEDMKSIERANWEKTKIADVMRPVAADQFVETGTPLSDAQKQMRNNEIGAVAVIDSEGNIVGFLRSGKIKRRNN